MKLLQTKSPPVQTLKNLLKITVLLKLIHKLYRCTRISPIGTKNSYDFLDINLIPKEEINDMFVSFFLFCKFFLNLNL